MSRPGLNAPGGVAAPRAATHASFALLPPQPPPPFSPSPAPTPPHTERRAQAPSSSSSSSSATGAASDSVRDSNTPTHKADAPHQAEEAERSRERGTTAQRRHNGARSSGCMSGPHPSARMTNQPPPIVSPHRCGAAGRWNSDSTSLSWAQAQSTHHPNAKTNLPSTPARAAATGSGTAILLAQ